MSVASVERRLRRSGRWEGTDPSTLLAAGFGLLLLVGAILSGSSGNGAPLLASQCGALVMYGLVAFRAPAATLPTLIFLLYTRLSDFIWPADWRLSLSQIVVALTVAGLLRQRGLRWGLRARDPLILGLLAYAAAMLLSAPTSLNPIGTLAELVAYLRNVLLVVLIGSLIANGAALRRAIWALVAGAALLSLLAWLNLATGAELSGLAGHATQCEPPICAARLEGPAGIDNNYFAQLLLTAVPLALTLAGTTGPFGSRLLALAAGVLVISVTLGTFSRGGYIGLVVVLGWLVWRARRTPVRLIWATLALVLTLIATPPILLVRFGYVTDRLTEVTASGGTRLPDPGPGRGSTVVPLSGPPTTSTPLIQAPAAPTDESGLILDSQYERSKLALIGLTAFLDRPLTGLGKGSYLAAFPRYAPRVDPLLTAPKFAHNLPIQIGAETGLIGLAAFVATIVAALRRLHQARRTLTAAGHSSEEMLLGAVELAIYGFLVGGLFLGDNVYLRYLWLLVGLAAAAPRLAQAAAGKLTGAKIAPT